MRRFAAAILVALVVTGCTAPAPAAPEEPGPPLPTSWTLDLSVIPSDRIHLNGGSIDAYEHSVTVAVDAESGDPADHCSVAASLSGYGGADRWVGEQIPTSVRGRPALRNGAGAEGPYLTWKDSEDRWIAVQCEQEVTMPVVADRVRERTSRLRVPYALTPPLGYVVTSVRVSTNPVTSVIVSLDHPDQTYEDSLDVSLNRSEFADIPTGEPTTIGGRPALRTDNPKFPQVCVTARPTPPAYVCVGITPDDTGPYPDRTDDVPAIEALATSLRFADVDDPSTWFDAEEALR